MSNPQDITSPPTKPSLGSEISGAMRGLVAKAPASETDAMLVTLAGQSSAYPFHVPSGYWTPRGTALPVVGNACLVVFDNRGDAWVPVWKPS